MQVDLGAVTAIEEVVLVPAHVVYGGHPGPGFGFPPRFKVEVADTPDFAAPRMVADHTAADFPHPGDDLVRLPAAGVNGRYVRVTATRLWKRTDDWIFALAELQVRGNSGNLAIGKTVTALDSIEAAPSWARVNLVDGRSSLRKIDDDGQPTRREVLAKEIAAAEKARAELVAALTDAETRREHDRLTAELASIEKQLHALPKPQQVYAAAREFSAQGSFQPPREPRPVHLLVRGDVKSRGPLVAPAAPACVQGPHADVCDSTTRNDEGAAARRLAHWLTDPANALTWRSIVNRVWQYHFGQGLVDTPNDFGRMGSLPTHPELLDWLAGWFIDHGSRSSSCTGCSSPAPSIGSRPPRTSEFAQARRRQSLPVADESRAARRRVRPRRHAGGLRQARPDDGRPQRAAVLLQGRPLAGLRLRPVRRRRPAQHCAAASIASWCAACPTRSWNAWTAPIRRS